jgi:hypothetical protein
VRYASEPVPSLGGRAALEHIHARATGGTSRFLTLVMFQVGQLRGNTSVVRGDRTNADRLALNLAEELRSRMR